jgi:methylated-DNA-[protein]-cysteine S-methyltransferase
MKNLNKLCYELLKKIPKGKITTYKIIADELGVKSYRGVGQIIGANPNAPQVPCHRVVKSTGEISGYAFGVDKKIALLKQEGVEVENGKIVNFEQKIFKF